MFPLPDGSDMNPLNVFHKDVTHFLMTLAAFHLKQLEQH